MCLHSSVSGRAVRGVRRALLRARLRDMYAPINVAISRFACVFLWLDARSVLTPVDDHKALLYTSPRIHCTVVWQAQDKLHELLRALSSRAGHPRRLRRWHMLQRWHMLSPGRLPLLGLGVWPVVLPPLRRRHVRRPRRLRRGRRLRLRPALPRRNLRWLR